MYLYKNQNQTIKTLRLLHDAFSAFEHINPPEGGGGDKIKDSFSGLTFFGEGVNCLPCKEVKNVVVLSREEAYIEI